MEKTKKVIAKKTQTINIPSNEFTSEILEAGKELKKIVASTAQEINEKVSFNKSVDAIKVSVNTVGSEIKETATDVMNEVMEMTEDIKDVATKNAKKITTKVEKEVSDTVKSAKNNFTAAKKKVNSVSKNAEAALTKNATELKKNTVKLANDIIANMKVNDTVKAIKGTVGNINSFALENTSEIIDALEANGLKWQGVSEKAIKSAMKLSKSQSNLLFSTLEEVKSQLVATSNRFKKLMS